VTVEPEYMTGELFTPSSESQRLSRLWQQLSADTRAEIERRAKANGFTLVDQLRASFPTPEPSGARAPAEPAGCRTSPPAMPELIQALDRLIELMKRT
jgi:hypothetical protein